MEHRSDAAPEPRQVVAPAPLTFSDVVDHIRALADLAGESDHPAMIEACRRAEDLLSALREQFLHDVVLTRPISVGRAA